MRFGGTETPAKKKNGFEIKFRMLFLFELIS
jgi:hypothetical protein